MGHPGFCGGSKKLWVGHPPHMSMLGMWVTRLWESVRSAPPATHDIVIRDILWLPALRTCGKRESFFERFHSERRTLLNRISAVLMLCCVALTGCTLPSGGGPTFQVTGAPISGKLLSSTAPVSGAHVYLMAVAATG